MAGDTCDVCLKSDVKIAGVASSSLGAMSFAFCGVCLAMRAEPKYWVYSAIEAIGGIENVHENVCLTYYDIKTDGYVDVRDGPQSIKLKDGRKFTTRKELILALDL